MAGFQALNVDSGHGGERLSTSVFGSVLRTYRRHGDGGKFLSIEILRGKFVKLVQVIPITFFLVPPPVRKKILMAQI